MEHQPASGPPSLRTLCERIIFTHRDWLGDIGSVPALLLEDCLHACSAQQLARIEDETSEGGVDVSADLAHHWKRCFEQRFGLFDTRKEQAPRLESVTQLSSSNAGAVVDWRALYQWREEQYEAKLRASGERLRQRTAAESSGRDSRSIQVLSAAPRRLPAQKGSYRGAALPSQAPGSRHRLLRKLGMGSSQQSPPARRFSIIKRAPGAKGTANKESNLVGSASQLVESELDLTLSSNSFMPRPVGTTHQHDTPSMASSASSGSLALHMTDNRFVSQPAFEERLRSAPDKQLPRTHGQLRASRGQAAALPSQATGQVAKQGLKEAGHPGLTSKLGRITAQSKALPELLPPRAHHRSLTSLSGGMAATDSTSLQQTRVSMQPAATAAHLERGQNARVLSNSTVKIQAREPSSASGRALSTGRMQVSPQPKLQTTSKTKAQQESKVGAAEQPAKRIKYDHLLGGSALLSLAGKQKKRT